MHKVTIAGVFRFRTGVTPEEIQNFFKESGILVDVGLNAPTIADSGFKSVLIRKVSKTQYGFQFVYEADSVTSKYKTRENFDSNIFDLLYRHFGRNLQSWDIASADIILK